ncbi:MAG: protein kinase domain-containing protein [Streptomyces sp.]|uniref:WD40 repeat domain-containing serine/threonine protein kinase n=1 Tax=Streptomyces sp. TaxID=1931 RepID=UPI003D6C62CD
MSQPGRGRPAVPPVSGGQRPGWPTTPPPHQPLGPGDPAEVGPYRLEAVLGAGGMGRVYLGHTPAGSEVAVKLVHREYAGDRSFRKRFEQEVAAARRVQGLYTVPVVDADLRADEPWLATAYVPGPSLQHAVDEGGPPGGSPGGDPLPVDAALGLIARVAEALQSIHAAGVIHRDLKPSNIILTAEGPKVIDFGIARAADVTSVTGTGMRAGTPAYMAPEYIRGQDLTEAVDVFALGLVAHFAATGRLAFGGGSSHSVTYRILEQDPDLDDCPEPLRTVAARCLEKDPQRRPTPAEVIRLCRRSVPARATAEGTVVDVHSAPTQPGSQPVAPVPSGPPDAVGPPAPPPTRQDPAQGKPRHPPSASPPGPYSQNPHAALGALAQGGAGVPTGWILLGSLLLVAVAIAFFLPLYEPDRGSPPWLKPTTTLTSQSDSVSDVAFSPDGKTLAAGVQQGMVRLWDVAGRKQRATLTQHNEDGREQVQRISSVAYSPDGKMLAAVAGDGTVGLWDVAERRQIATLTASSSHPVRDVAFSPDGKLLATGGEEGKVRLWNAHSRKDRALATLDHGLPVWSVAFSPDGRTVASAAYEPDGGTQPTAKLWDVAGHKARHTFPHPKSVTGVAFSEDGRTLVTSSADDKVRRWDVAGGREGDPLTAGGFTSTDEVASSPDGKTLATVHWREVRLWDLVGGEPRAVLTGNTSEVRNLAFSPGGRLLATAADDGKVRLWRTAKAR